MRELSLIGIQQGYPKVRMKKNIKSVHSEYRDLTIVIKGINAIAL